MNQIEKAEIEMTVFGESQWKVCDRDVNRPEPDNGIRICGDNANLGRIFKVQSVNTLTGVSFACCVVCTVTQSQRFCASLGKWKLT